MGIWAYYLYCTVLYEVFLHLSQILNQLLAFLIHPVGYRPPAIEFDNGDIRKSLNCPIAIFQFDLILPGFFFSVRTSLCRDP